jgi:hypothetical protein
LTTMTIVDAGFDELISALVAARGRLILGWG